MTGYDGLQLRILWINK